MLADEPSATTDGAARYAKATAIPSRTENPPFLATKPRSGTPWKQFNRYDSSDLAFCLERFPFSVDKLRIPCQNAVSWPEMRLSSARRSGSAEQASQAPGQTEDPRVALSNGPHAPPPRESARLALTATFADDTTQAKTSTVAPVVGLKKRYDSYHKRRVTAFEA